MASTVGDRWLATYDARPDLPLVPTPRWARTVPGEVAAWPWAIFAHDSFGTPDRHLVLAASETDADALPALDEVVRDRGGHNLVLFCTDPDVVDRAQALGFGVERRWLGRRCAVTAEPLGPTNGAATLEQRPDLADGYLNLVNRSRLFPHIEPEVFRGLLAGDPLWQPAEQLVVEDAGEPVAALRINRVVREGQPSFATARNLVTGTAKLTQRIRGIGALVELSRALQHAVGVEQNWVTADPRERSISRLHRNMGYEDTRFTMHWLCRHVTRPCPVCKRRV